MTKLFVTSILSNTPYLFLHNKLFQTSNISILIPNYSLYYLVTHLKFASISRAVQLIDIFAYENPVTDSFTKTTNVNTNPIIVYQFQNLFSYERFFIFVGYTNATNTAIPKSLENLYAASAWLEREVGEMSGINFESKRDLRNLMLQYGDANAPFRKSYPSIGVKEIFYDSVVDTIVQVPTSIQI